MLATAFGFITPGLFNKKHDYPTYRVVLCICYLLFFFAYPFVVINSATRVDNKKGKAIKKTEQVDLLYGAESAAFVNIPIIVMACIHCMFALPQICI